MSASRAAVAGPLLLSALLFASACEDPAPPPPRPPVEDTRPRVGEYCTGTVGVCQGDLDVVCVDHHCRQGCRGGTACPEGTTCQRVDLRIEVGSGASAIEEGFDLCLPPS